MCIRHATLLVVVATAVAAAPTLGAQLTHAMPETLSDREFWDFFTTMSEVGGTFPSENFVSNEQTYQHVIPTLQSAVAPGSVYLGVGPEQNFTYIANLRPRMAVIFDIRRQNAMAHLMYKALFEIAPTRTAFLSLLFTRSLPTTIATSAPPSELFAALATAKGSDSMFTANRQTVLDRLQVKHGFALTPDDVQAITHVYRSFFEAGPSINYGYRTDQPMYGSYATYTEIQNLTNIAGVNMAFLATEANYRVVRDLQLQNLIVPVVGDFAGPKAIRAVGAYLTQRHATVGAFYLSNVEQYLFRGVSDASHFYENVKSLPVDSTSMFIRSVPAQGDPFGTVGTFQYARAGANAKSYSVSVIDSAGARIVTTTTTDSTGAVVTTRRVDTSAFRSSPLQIFNGLRLRDDSVARARLDSTFGWRTKDSTLAPPSSWTVVRSVLTGSAGLVSGIARIRPTLDAFAGGQLSSYSALVATTKVDGWR